MSHIQTSHYTAKAFIVKILCSDSPICHHRFNPEVSQINKIRDTGTQWSKETRTIKNCFIKHILEFVLNCQLLAGILLWKWCLSFEQFKWTLSIVSNLSSHWCPLISKHSFRVGRKNKELECFYMLCFHFRELTSYERVGLFLGMHLIPKVVLLEILQQYFLLAKKLF